MTIRDGAPKRTWRSRLHRAWVTTGSIVGVVFVVWSLLAYRARGEAHDALNSSQTVRVENLDGYWRFTPRQASNVGLLFFPGALVDPVAYAPILRAVAERGYTALLIQVPRRGAMGGAESEELLTRYARAIRETEASGGPGRWVAGGHSRGGVISCTVARSRPPWLGGLVLVGTSHPRDFSIANLAIPVTQIFGTRDTVADVEKVIAARRNLPASLTIVEIDGGNHSQFGSYGFQPGDWPATISRAEQHRRTLEAIVLALDRAAR